MGQNFEVIIGGAGPAGLATAVALARRGHRVLVLEAGELFRPKKIWLTFGEVARSHRLEDAVRLWCDRGHLIYYTNDPLEISRQDLIAVFDESRLLRILAYRIEDWRRILKARCPVIGLVRKSSRPTEVCVRTPIGEFSCNLFVDATGGRLQWDRASHLSDAYYTTYARIYEGCRPLLPLNEVVLLHKAYPGRALGQWSTPISCDRYLLGEVNFSTRTRVSSLDFDKDRSELSRRLDCYTWGSQDIVSVPPNARYKEYYGVVPVRHSPPAPRDNVVAIGDSGFQARPFFGVSIDQLFDQADLIAEAATSCFESGNFSAGSLAELVPQPGTQEQLNFAFGRFVWRILEVGPDSLGGELCAILDQLGQDLKYDLLRGRLTCDDLSMVVRLLWDNGFFRQLLADTRVNHLSGHIWAGGRLLRKLFSG